MARKLKSDTLLFTVTLLLLVVSVAWVYSASVVTADQKDNDPERFLIKQAMWVALGTVGLLLAMKQDYHVYRNRPVLWGLVVATTLALIAVFFCPKVNNAHRWLGLGGLGVQPSEFAKLVTILFIAFALERRLEGREPLEPGLPRIGLLLALFGGLILAEPDAGSTLVLAAVAITMLFVAGLAYRWVVGVLATAPWLFFLVLWLAPYRQRRLLAFWNPGADPQGAGWQVQQSLFAVGSGGVWGKGFMQGVQKMFYLPEAHSDFIYAVIAEEKGLIGAALVLLSFGLIVWRGIRIARRAPDVLGAMIAAGITAMIGLQALVNVSVVIGLLPPKGIALPFISAGGSSMVVSLVAMGILLNVSQQASVNG